MDYYDLFAKSASRLRNLPVIPNIKPKKLNHEYQTLNCLGKGGFGQVYEGRRRSDNTSVVMKFLPRERILNWGAFEGVCDPIIENMSNKLLLFIFIETSSI